MCSIFLILEFAFDVYSSSVFFFSCCREMKARLAATYPDAFPNGAMSKTMDQRPDLESPLD